MDILKPVQDALEGKIDFQGQKQVELWANWTFPSIVIISFIAGWLTSSTLNALICFATGFGVFLVLTVPPWPMHNRNPVQWRPVRKIGETGMTASPSGKKKMKK